MDKAYKVVTAKEMQTIDKKTINDYGIRSLVLMETAGLKCAEEIKRYIDSGTINIFCGKGNNGGDGFVIGRILKNEGHDVQLYLIGKKTELKNDALINAEAFINFGNQIIEIESEDDLKQINLEAHSLVVDAILGNGINGPLRGIILEVVKHINRSSCKVIAIDIPTGVPTDQPCLFGEVLDADLTLTIGLPKIALMIYPTKKYIGELKVIDINFPHELLNDPALKISSISKELVCKLLPKRALDIHKGTAGSLGIVAGSIGMSGAAILCSKAAFLTGVGYVKLGIPKSLNSVCEKHLLETLTFPLDETCAESISLRAFSEIQNIIKGANAFLVGPGLSSNNETQELILKMVNDFDQNFVIDADGLNALAGNQSILENNKKNIILTPHIGEMSKLTGMKTEEILKDPVQVARDFSKKWNAIIVLKSATTVIAEPCGHAYINTIGNDGMATAGSGDVLCGVIAGCLAQGINAISAAVLGTWLHSYAGDLATKEKGKNALLASDILDKLSQSIRSIE